MGSVVTQSEPMSTLLEGVKFAASQTPAAFQNSVTKTYSSIAAIQPTTPETDVFLLNVIPNWFRQAFPPLIDAPLTSPYANNAGGAVGGPSSSELGPDTTHGYGFSYTGTIQYASGAAVFYVTRQRTSLASASWTFAVGIVDAEGKWTAPKAVVLPDTQVSVDANGFATTSESPIQFSLSVQMTSVTVSFSLPGATVQGTAASTLTPRYRQSGSSVQTIVIFQAGGFSVVDGVFNATNTLTVQGGQPVTAGTFWLRYVTEGFKAPNVMQTMLTGLAPSTVPKQIPVLFLGIQLSDESFTGGIDNELDAFFKGSVITKADTGSAWSATAPPVFNAETSYELISDFPDTGVPAQVRFRINDRIYVLKSTAKDLPLIITPAGSFYQIPCDVYLSLGLKLVNGAKGWMTYVAPDSYPTPVQAVAASGVPSTILTASTTSAPAISTFSFFVISMALVFTALVVTITLFIEGAHIHKILKRK